MRPAWQPRAVPLLWLPRRLRIAPALIPPLGVIRFDKIFLPFSVPADGHVIGFSRGRFQRLVLPLEQNNALAERFDRRRHVGRVELLRDVLGTVNVPRLDVDEDRLLGSRRIAFRHQRR